MGRGRGAHGGEMHLGSWLRPQWCAVLCDCGQVIDTSRVPAPGPLKGGKVPPPRAQWPCHRKNGGRRRWSGAA